MSLFRRKKVYTLVKKSRLKKDGWETYYFTKMDDRFIPNSMFTEKEAAEEFFDKLIRFKGENEIETVLITKKV